MNKMNNGNGLSICSRKMHLRFIINIVFITLLSLESIFIVHIEDIIKSVGEKTELIRFFTMKVTRLNSYNSVQ